ncbi:MAG: ATP synthase F1 subunit gamma, partial [Chloroflexi bacterium]|nr:ATP synthase F1 subunit gamma [Chloroflexota bacterium]
ISLPMANLREIKRHIQSVQAIAKVTNALEVISAAKNLRLQSRVHNSRLFAIKSWEVLTHLASAAEPELETNPMFCGYRQVERIGMLLITSNKGMAGPYNYNMLERANAYIEAQRAPVELITIGREGREAMLRRGREIHADFILPEDAIELSDMNPVAQVVLDGFSQRHFDEMVLAYTQFQPGARLVPTVRPLLPFCPEAPSERREYVYEPEPAELLRSLLPRVIRFQIFQAYLESLMAENTSRQVAMRAATQNAEDLVQDLTMTYNKARQQAITAELADLLGGRMHVTG